MSARRISVKGRPHIYYRLLPNGRRRYEISFTDEQDRRRWLTVDGGLAAAEAALEERKRRKRSGEPVAPGKVRFREFAEAWLQGQQQLREGTRTLYRGHLERHVFPRLGNLWLHEIDEADIVHLIGELREAGLSPYTIRGVLQPLGRVLGSALRRKLIASNPVRNLERGERPKLERAEITILGSEGIARLLDAASEEWRPLLALSVFAGLRQSEALGLTWADIHLEQEVIHVRRQLDRSGRRVALKTPQSARTVVIFPALAKLLRAHREHQLASGFASPESFVFTTRTGSPLGHRNVARQALDPALERAGLPSMRWHDLRHTCASLLIAQGQSDVFVARQLGHASPSITRDVYSHLFDAAEHAARMREGLEAAYGRSLERTGDHPPLDRSPAEAANVAELREIGTGVHS